MTKSQDSPLKSLSSNDLIQIFEESLKEKTKEKQVVGIPPAFQKLFSWKLEDFDEKITGVDLIQSESFAFQAKMFPTLPRQIPFKLLYMLGTKTAPISNNKYSNLWRKYNQQIFWSYMMLECDNTTYNKFLEMHSEKIREMASPIC